MNELGTPATAKPVNCGRVAIPCCVEREDEGRGSDRLAMTGGAPKSPNYIINPSDQGHRVKGHEKGASWGGEDPQPLRQPRANSFTQQLKTVMERCEKMTPGDKFLPKVDRDGKHLGDNDYSIPSPPERDLDHFSKYNETRLSQLSIDGGYDGSQTSLTRAELEQYTRAYEDVRPVSHSQQPSYAQSEGYHSYVSSADSTSTTPFLDRLRRDNIDTSCMVGISSSSGGRESSASSGSSSETLKWHGSMSDVSSSAGGHSGSHSSHSGGHTTPHIAHSARVPMPQRHHSESVLYLDPSSQHHQNNINSQMRRLFPVTTYEPTSPRHLIESYSPSSSSRSQPKLSVAERVCEIERQTTRPLPPQPTTDHSIDKRSSRLPDHAALKAMQKKALLSFYERHHSAWKSEPQLTTPSMSSLPTPGPPQPPPRAQPPLPVPASRRSSSASDYAGAVKREIPRSHLDLSKVESNGIRESKHQHSSSCGSLTTAALGPMIVGPAISVDDWVPARPPKKPHLRGAPTVYQQRPPPLRVASPEPPPPSPPAVTEDEILYNADEPLPPPPPEEFLIHRPASLSKHEKARFERAMNASMSLDNLTRSDGKPPPLLLPKSPVHQDTSPGIRPHQDTSASRLDGYYENGSDLKHSHKNGFIEKFNERYVENRIESMQSNYADSLAEIWDKKSPPGYVEMRRFDKKMQPLEPPERHAPRHAARLTSPPLPLKGKRPYNSEHQPRSLDSSGLSIVERQNEVNRPGPQTPVSKKYNHQGLSKNASERQSLRFTTSSQKLVVNGKIAVAVQNGKISPTGPVTSRKANLARTPSDAAYGNHSNHGLHRAQPVKSPPAATPESPKPALPPHCPPTSLQL
ncbi:Hypothetical protein NTJ_15520 [Nesidiocoris tenuis]|uniref:Protein Shroom n=1 Tax=Nesidiocoris tenuis TaxID=355587 RepID=A0ABN7BEA6_9HEMI|nr:Hypothetical protein NTJ_15520 [Nesidiocoris tenuis]